MTITSAFGYHSTAREVVADRDLSGTTALVTGAASGIGVETARALALAGADGTAAGVTALESEDWAPSPTPLVAETLKV